MAAHIKISILNPNDHDSNSRFSIRLKPPMAKEPENWFVPSSVTVLSLIAGDFAANLRLLRKCRIIDDTGNWIYQDGHLALMGNCLTGSEESVRLLWFIYGLDSKALRKGGYVHFIPARQDMENMDGPWRKLQPQYAPPSHDAVSRYTILYDGNEELHRWLLTKQMRIKMSDTAILQCGLDDVAVNPLLEKIPAACREIIRMDPESISYEQLQQLKTILFAKTLVLVNAHAGTARIFKNEKHDYRSYPMPLRRTNNRWSSIGDSKKD